MIERIVGWAVRRRLWVLVATLLGVVAGGYYLTQLRFDALPDVTGKQVTVLTRAPGFTPVEVEQLVTRPVEVALSGLPELETQRSISRYGISSVTATFEEDADLYRARQLVAEALAGLGDGLPEGVEAPAVGPITGGLGEIYQFSLSSPDRTTAELLELAELRIAPLLRGVDGVVEVNTWGGQRRTYDVVGHPQRMAARGVRLDELKQAVAQATGYAAGAFLPSGEGRTLLRGMARPQSPADLAEGVVRREPDGTVIRIGDVADVREGAAPRLGAATRNGRGETVYVMVQMLLGANALEVVGDVKARMPEVRAALPDDVRVDIAYDRSELVMATLETVGKNLLEGGLLVILVLFAMLGSLRAGLIVASIIPLSMLGATVGMVLLEVPGNLMSLGALDFGLLVDGGVVMVEAVFHALHRLGRDAEEGTFKARVADVTQQVARPVFYSVLIILLVYVPILSLSGVEGKMFRPMALTVVFALSTSLMLSLTYVPAMASYTLRPKDVPERDPWIVRQAIALYRPALRFTAHHPPLVLAFALGLIGVGGVLFSQVGTAFVPQLQEGDLVIQTTREPDISVASAVDQAQELERALVDHVPEVTQVASRIGSPAVATDIMGIEQADVFVDLKPRDQWREGMDYAALIEHIQAVLDEHAAGGDPSFTQPIQMRFNELLGGEVSDVALSIFGEDLDQLRVLAERAKTHLVKVDGAVDVRISSPPSVSLVEVRPRPLAGAQQAFSAEEVLDVIRGIESGIDVGATYEGRLRIPLRVRMGQPPEAPSLESFAVPASRMTTLPLSRIAEVVRLESPALVSHDEAQRRIVIGFNVRGADLGTVVEDAKQAMQEVELPRGYRLRWGGRYENLQSAQQRLALVIPAVLLLIIAILVGVFQSLRPALIIFLNVPFAAVGGIVALSARGLPLSISAAIGFIALSGIATLNGVVLMSRIQSHQAQYDDPVRAAVVGGLERMRPVLMTALVAALGFVPMTIATGIGAEVQRPLATVVVGGLLTSTILTLLILPSLYPWLSGRAGSAEARRRSTDAAFDEVEA